MTLDRWIYAALIFLALSLQYGCSDPLPQQRIRWVLDDGGSIECVVSATQTGIVASIDNCELKDQR